MSVTMSWCVAPRAKWGGANDRRNLLLTCKGRRNEISKLKMEVTLFPEIPVEYLYIKFHGTSHRRC